MDFMPAARVHAHRQEKAVLVACHAALRAAMALKLLEAAAMEDDA